MHSTNGNTKSAGCRIEIPEWVRDVAHVIVRRKRRARETASAPEAKLLRASALALTRGLANEFEKRRARRAGGA